jgi:hypothetical protein
MSKQTRKGNSEGEIPVENYLRSRGFRRAYRLRHQGVIDKGDIGGIDGVCIEVKNWGVYKIAEWVKEMLHEKANAKARIGAVLMKPKGIGKTRVDQWWIVMPVSDFTQLLIEAGYGPYEGPHDGG